MSNITWFCVDCGRAIAPSDANVERRDDYFRHLVCPEAKDAEGRKFDQEKLDWSVLPLELLEPLVEVFKAGEQKYGYHNWKKQFENGERRFFAAAMRHGKDCQDDPLARDEDTGCLHGAQAAWNMLMRLYHAKED